MLVVTECVQSQMIGSVLTERKRRDADESGRSDPDRGVCQADRKGHDHGGGQMPARSAARRPEDRAGLVCAEGRAVSGFQDQKRELYRKQEKMNQDEPS